jgi:hypothetical protein
MDLACFINGLRFSNMNRWSLTRRTDFASNGTDEITTPDVRALSISQQVRNRQISFRNVLAVKRGLLVAKLCQQIV